MRGKVAVFCCAVGAHGITPAYAGKSHSATPCSPAVWDHPRVCGEKAVFDMCSCHSLGSPPRMRGKDVQPCRFGVAVRITPAYAGKSESIDIQGEIERDHPRVCGEKFFAHSFQFCLAGSPPRMRGKETLFPALTPFFRITPAYAGKSKTMHPQCEQ